MWLRYHEQAEQTGARLVHSCGFDSIPYDLGALFTVQQLPEGVPIKLEGSCRAGGTFSGGTYHSAIHIMGRLRQGDAGRARAQAARAAPDGPARARRRRASRTTTTIAGGWVVPFPTIDPQTVLRSARALDRYGPDFSYSHYLVVKRLPVLVGHGARAPARVIALAQLPPTRDLLLKLKDPGEGPIAGAARARRGSRSVRRRGRRQAGRRPRCPGGDPGYGETSKMLAESALCLAHDDLPDARRAAHPGGRDGRRADQPAAGGRDRLRRSRRQA